MIMNDTTNQIENPLKGCLKFKDIDTLEVHDCETNKYHKLADVKVIGTCLNKYGDEFCHYVTPDTGRVASSVVVHLF